MAQSMPIEMGTRLGAYEVKEPIGRGAMGVVYRAHHAGLNRQAAVKVLQALAPDPESHQRFRREAQSIALMRHPNILQVFDYGEVDGVPYSIVEYVPGGSLGDRLRAGHRPNYQATLNLLRGVASALDYAHGLGVIHRDVKPANVLLGRDDAPVLADFGLVKLLESASVRSMTGMTTGTPAYMSPEQVTGGEIGPASDRYALACMSFELLTGSLPFEGVGVLEQLYAHVHREPPAASSIKHELPLGVDAVLDRGLAKEPEARWSSCTEMVDALAAALRGTSPAPLLPAAAGAVQGAPPPAASLSPAPGAALPPVALAAPRASPAAAPRRRRGRVAVAVGAVALISVLTLVLIAAIRPATGSAAPARGPVVALSASEVPAGTSIVASATNLAHNQSGTVELQSTPTRLAAFTADRDGNATATVTIPKSTRTGAHKVAFCWSNSCPATAALTVLDPLPDVVATPSPGPTGSPRAGFHPEITTVLPSPLRINGGVFVSGGNFDPGARGITLVLIEYGHDGATLGIQDKPVEPNGSFTWQGNLPAGNWVPGQAFIRVCNIGEPNICADKAVTLTR